MTFRREGKERRSSVSVREVTQVQSLAYSDSWIVQDMHRFDFKGTACLGIKSSGLSVGGDGVAATHCGMHCTAIPAAQVWALRMK